VNLAKSWAKALEQSRFLRFAVVGGAGFVVSQAGLYVALNLLHLGDTGAWLFAFFCAVTFTWWGNRMLTFREHAAVGARGIVFEWARFVAANGIGAVVNFVVYTACIRFAPAPLNSHYIALALGTIVALVFNFTLSQRLVFRAR
jgi:putative flippase GtrA